jgi:hypothetical protein
MENLSLFPGLPATIWQQIWSGPASLGPLREARFEEGRHPCPASVEAPALQAPRDPAGIISSQNSEVAGFNRRTGGKAILKVDPQALIMS